MQALSQLSYGPTSLRSEIIAVPPGVGKRFVALFFTRGALPMSALLPPRRPRVHALSSVNAARIGH